MFAFKPTDEHEVCGQIYYRLRETTKDPLKEIFVQKLANYTVEKLFMIQKPQTAPHTFLHLI